MEGEGEREEGEGPSMPTWPRFPLEIAKICESRDLGIDLR